MTLSEHAISVPMGNREYQEGFLFQRQEKGKASENPYPHNSEEARSWHKGYQDSITWSKVKKG